jgi:hypothetical protein
MIIFIVLVIKNKNIMENVLSVMAMVIRMVTIIWLSLFNI